MSLVIVWAIGTAVTLSVSVMRYAIDARRARLSDAAALIAIAVAWPAWWIALIIVRIHDWRRRT